ncbi:MAG: hypothetical protein V1779_16530 [bacterium]
MKQKKTFDCVELQRKIRNKLVQEAEMDIDKFFDLINKRKTSSSIYKKLTENYEKQSEPLIYTD